MEERTYGREEGKEFHKEVYYDDDHDNNNNNFVVLSLLLLALLLHWSIGLYPSSVVVVEN